MRQSLLAAAVDDDAARELLEARLERELEPRGFGTLSAHAPAAPAATGSSEGPASSEPATSDRAELSVARVALREAQADLHAAEAEERQARRHLEQTQRETEKARAAVEKARSDVDRLPRRSSST